MFSVSWSRGRLIVVDRNRLKYLFSEAGLDAQPVSETPPQSLDDLVAAVLATANWSAEEMETVQRALAVRPKTSTIATSIGAGFSAWSMAQSGRLLDLGLEAGAGVADFIVTNLDTLANGWEGVLPQIPGALTEIVLRLPGGTIQLATDLIYLYEHKEMLLETLGWAIEHGADWFQALDAVELGANVVDVAEGAAMLGFSVLAGWAVGKLIDRHYEPILRKKTERLEDLRQLCIELRKLRRAVCSNLPSSIVASQLAAVDQEHWGF
jgi:hypothetical protein